MYKYTLSLMLKLWRAGRSFCYVNLPRIFFRTSLNRVPHQSEKGRGRKNKKLKTGAFFQGVRRLRQLRGLLA